MRTGHKKVILDYGGLTLKENCKRFFRIEVVVLLYIQIAAYDNYAQLRYTETRRLLLGKVTNMNHLLFTHLLCLLLPIG